MNREIKINMDITEIKQAKEEANQREQTTIRLPAELKERLQQEADRKGLSFNQLVLIVIKKYLNHQK